MCLPVLAVESTGAERSSELRRHTACDFWGQGIFIESTEASKHDLAWCYSILAITKHIHLAGEVCEKEMGVGTGNVIWLAGRI